MDRKIGRSSRFARSSASSPHGYQSTGLCACCSRYGLVSPASRFVCVWVVMTAFLSAPRALLSILDRNPRNHLYAKEWLSGVGVIEGSDLAQMTCRTDESLSLSF